MNRKFPVNADKGPVPENFFTLFLDSFTLLLVRQKGNGTVIVWVGWSSVKGRMKIYLEERIWQRSNDVTHM